MAEQPAAARENWERHAAGGVALWTPPGWQETTAAGLDLAVVGPPGAGPGAYRANVTLAFQEVPADATLEQIVQAATQQQQTSLSDFLEYERVRRTVADHPALERQYAWWEQPPGIVLYQHQLTVLLPAGAGGQSGAGAAGSRGARLLQVHATSDGPAYFRFAAIFRRVLDSITLEG